MVWACLNCNSQNYNHLVYDCIIPNYDKLQQFISDKNLSIDSLNEDAKAKYESAPRWNRRQCQKVKPLKLINVTFQSHTNKIGAWRNIIDCTEPDIIVSTETWLKTDIHDAELELDDYAVFRKDRAQDIGSEVSGSAGN